MNKNFNFPRNSFKNPLLKLTISCWQNVHGNGTAHSQIVTEKVSQFKMPLKSIYTSNFCINKCNCISKHCGKVTKFNNLCNFFFCFKNVLFTFSELPTISLQLYYLTMYSSIIHLMLEDCVYLAFLENLDVIDGTRSFGKT